MQISTRDEDFIVDTKTTDLCWFIPKRCVQRPFEEKGQYIFSFGSHLCICSFCLRLSWKVSFYQVMHGADNDVLWLQRDFGIYVCNLFDTHQVYTWTCSTMKLILVNFLVLKVFLLPSSKAKEGLYLVVLNLYFLCIFLVNCTWYLNITLVNIQLQTARKLLAHLFSSFRIAWNAVFVPVPNSLILGVTWFLCGITGLSRVECEEP